MTSRALRIAALMFMPGAVRPLLAQDASSDASAESRAGQEARRIGGSSVADNACADWMIDDNFTLRRVGGGADPGDLVRQLNGRTADGALGALCLAYSD